MSLPTRQQRILDQIELVLQAGDPRMKSTFAAFTRFTSWDVIPTTEAISARMPRMRVLIPIMLVTVLSVVFLGIFATSTACPRLSSDQAVTSAATRLAACTNSTDAWSKGGR